MEPQEERTISAAIARVVDSYNDGEPQVLDVDGVLYRREHDQESARRDLAQRQRYEQIIGCGVSPSLLQAYQLVVAGEIIDEQDECMRRIGHLLVFHGQHELWRLAYCEYTQGNGYALGDETLFLLHQPTAGQDGYAGPPASRLNTAIEQAEQLRRRSRPPEGQP